MKALPTNPSEAVKRRNPTLYSMWKDAVAESENPKERRIRQSQKPLVNRLEQEWWARLEEKYSSHTFHPQAIRFKLGNGIWYKPDLVCFSLMECWEVKGPHAFRGGFENLKVAASQYREYRWTLVWKDNGQWKEQLVLP